jgi:DNA repair protein RecO (recombination protein O)
MSRESRSYRAEGIVLRRRNIGEADSIFVVFGEHDGKFEGIARGIRKTRSRMRGHLEPLTYSRFQMARGRTLDVFTQAETLRSFPAIRDDLDRWATASYLLELVDRFTVELAENLPLFHLLYAALEALDEGAPVSSVARYFELHLLAVSGFHVQLDSCADCGGRLPEEPALLSSSTGGLVCRQCRPEAGVGRLVPVGAIKVLRHANRVSLPEFVELRVPEDLARELESALGDLVRYYLEREPRTARFVRELAASDFRATPDVETL